MNDDYRTGFGSMFDKVHRGMDMGRKFRVGASWDIEGAEDVPIPPSVLEKKVRRNWVSDYVTLEKDKYLILKSVRNMLDPDFERWEVVSGLKVVPVAWIVAITMEDMNTDGRPVIFWMDSPSGDTQGLRCTKEWMEAHLKVCRGVVESK